MGEVRADEAPDQGPAEPGEPVLPAAPAAPGRAVPEWIVERLELSLARGRQLLALTRALSDALSVEAVTDAVTASARHALGTLFAGIALVDDGGRTLRYVSMAPLPEETTAVWSRVPLSRPAPLTDAARLARPFFHDSVAAAVADFPGIGEHMVTAGAAAMAHLPLVSGGGQVLGTLALTWPVPHAMGEEERGFLVTVAGYTAQALERAQLFERQRSAAETLQQAVLPDVLPAVPGYSLGARFVPASGSGEVGGDWYDAFVLPEGRLAVAVGDAAGHGLPAARVMSALRNALRAYALLDGGPGEVLALLDRLVAHHDPDAFATLAYLELDPRTGEGVWASSGHLPLLRIGADGTTAFSGERPDPPVGLLGPGGPTEHRLRLGPGETLLLFTDGLVERREDDLDAGLAGLRHALHAQDGPVPAPASLVEHLTSALLAPGGPPDDVCLVAIRRDPVAAPVPDTVRGPDDDAVEEVLAPHATAAQQGRDLARGALHGWGLGHLAETVALVVSELVTNAVTHAGSEVRLRLERVAGTVRVVVCDASPAAPQHRDAGPGEEHGRGVHLVDALVARWGTEPAGGGKCVWAEVDVV